MDRRGFLWLSVDEFAERYNVSRRLVFKWLEAGGVLHHWRKGRVLRIWNHEPPHFDAHGERG